MLSSARSRSSGIGSPLHDLCPRDEIRERDLRDIPHRRRLLDRSDRVRVVRRRFPDLRRDGDRRLRILRRRVILLARVDPEARDLADAEAADAALHRLAQDEERQRLDPVDDLVERQEDVRALDERPIGTESEPLLEIVVDLFGIRDLRIVDEDPDAAVDDRPEEIEPDEDGERGPRAIDILRETLEDRAPYRRRASARSA
jgi:hypothetical protein